MSARRRARAAGGALILLVSAASPLACATTPTTSAAATGPALVIVDRERGHTLFSGAELAVAAPDEHTLVVPLEGVGTLVVRRAPDGARTCQLARVALDGERARAPWTDDDPPRHLVEDRACAAVRTEDGRLCVDRAQLTVARRATWSPPLLVDGCAWIAAR